MTEFSSYSDGDFNRHNLCYLVWSFRKFRKKIFCTGNTVIFVLFFRFFSILRVSALLRFFSFLICYVESKTAYLREKKSIPPDVPGVLFGRKVQKKQTNSRKIIVFLLFVLMKRDEKYEILCFFFADFRENCVCLAFLILVTFFFILSSIFLSWSNIFLSLKSCN